MHNMFRYRNIWHDPLARPEDLWPGSRPYYGPEFFETHIEPEEYRGFQIFERVPGQWDIVFEDTCVGQYAGPNGARRAIDALCGDPGEAMDIQRSLIDSGRGKTDPVLRKLLDGKGLPHGE